MRSVKIISVGSYLPKHILESKTLEQQFQLSSAWIERKNGIVSRHICQNETPQQMCFYALQDALKRANLSPEQIDCLVYAGGAIIQPIPCGASLVSRLFDGELEGVPCFDINATCLSAVVGLDTLSYLLEAGRYNTIAIVAGDKVSAALNPKDCKTSTLFGDAATAMIIQKTPENETAGIIDSCFETYPRYADFAQVKGGGSLLPAYRYTPEKDADYRFHMDGEKIYRYAAKNLPIFLEKLLSRNHLTLKDIDMIIPHQASGLSLKLMQKKLNIPDSKWYVNIQTLGNTVSASIPLALKDAVDTGRVKRGDKIMLAGTSAGLTLGAMLLEY